MKPIVIGILLGMAAGIVDIIPMVLKKLPWDANLSAFAMWVIIGFFIASIHIDVQPVLKGILIAFLVLLPSGILIGWKEPKSLIPIIIMTAILGGVLGYVIPKFIS
ncbi:MAG: hypothetical protein R2751_14355 [Bacteroidales bacterium]